MTPLQQVIEKWRDGCGSSICAGAGRRVHFRGSSPCDILFVGEAPGDAEDLFGLPFVGPAGQYQDRYIERAFRLTSFTPADVPIGFANLVGCFPRYDGKKGEPEDADIQCCAPRLWDLVTAVEPLAIVNVGKLSKDWLEQGLKGNVAIPTACPVCRRPQYEAETQDRLVCLSGHESQTGELIPQVAITHPAAILRSRQDQKDMLVQINTARIAGVIRTLLPQIKESIRAASQG